jgi:heme exporter protein B
MAFTRLVFVIMAKDLRAELRTKEAVNASLAFAVVILVLLSFVVESADVPQKTLGNLLWLVFAFAGTLVLNRSFAREVPNDCLDALVAAPVSGATLFLGKALASFLLVLAMELVAYPIFGIFYNVRWTQQFWELMLVTVLATWGVTVIGTVFSALTVNIRLREVMLPMLIYPMLLPALLGAMELTGDLVTGTPIGPDTVTWLKLLVGFDVLFTAAAVTLVEFVLVG